MAGTIRKKGDNKWEMRVCYGTAPNGSPRRFSKTIEAKSEREAQKELALFYASIVSGDISKGSNVSVADMLEYWLEHYVRQNLKPATIYSNELLSKKICETFGNHKASTLRTVDVQEWVYELQKTHSAKTTIGYYSILNQAYKYSIKLGILEHNPCLNIFLPKREKHEARFLSESEIKAVVSALGELSPDEISYKVAIELMLFGGLRRGEVLGLDWDCVNFEDCSIQIKKARIDSAGGVMIESTPKTKLSARVVSLPKALFSDLTALKQFNDKLCDLLEKSESAVILGLKGSPMNVKVLETWWHRFLDKNEIEYINLHGLRHTHTAMLLDLGAEVFDISRHLGHSNTGTTMNIYAHLINNKDKVFADKLSKFL